MKVSLFATVAALVVGAGARAGSPPINVSFAEPTLDRWNYPMNFTPGIRESASSFAALNEVDFDDRDGQILLGWDTGAQAPIGQGASNYQILEARVIIGVATGGLFQYDPTHDAVETHYNAGDPELIPDSDAGRPVELFGVGYRNGFTHATYLENSPFKNGEASDTGVRNAFPIDLFAGSTADISNQIVDRIEVSSWAVGINGVLTPGQLVASETDLTFEIDISNPHVREYLREGLDEGRIRLMISSLHSAVQQGGVFSDFFMRESFFNFDQSGRLEMVVEIGPPCDADFNGDGAVNSGDMAALLGSWGQQNIAADLDLSGEVGAPDLAQLLGAWGACP